MNGNSLGKIFTVTTWGESHGAAVGAVIDGCPAGLLLAPEDFLEDMRRRQGGHEKFSTPRSEADLVLIESGVFEGRTTGTPISLRILNEKQNSSDYEAYRHVPRPGHADLTTHLKHGHRDFRGGGRSSARETTARVAAGVIAKKILATKGVQILAWVGRVGSEPANAPAESSLTQLKSLRDNNPLFLPLSAEASESYFSLVDKLREEMNSLGGAVACRVDGLTVGIGEPVFDKLQALLAHALMSLPAAVAFEAGGGHALSLVPGSEVRDPIQNTSHGPRPAGNRHGGLLGGITTGHPLLMSVAFHAPTSIPRAIESVDLRTGQSTEVTVGGRHDAFPLPRAVPMVEAMAAITLVDALFRARLDELV